MADPPRLKIGDTATVANEPTPMRWGRLEDTDRIAAYHHACWLQAFAPLVSAEVMDTIEPRVERWREWLSDGSDLTTVVAVDAADEPIGHCTVSGNELVHLFIDPEYHGKGLGRQLLAVAERLLRNAGHRHIQLHTIVGNAPAIGLYLACGWVMTDEIEDDHLPNGACYSEHILRKDLDAIVPVDANRDQWNAEAVNWVDRGRHAWSAEPHWGLMAIADSTVDVLSDLADRDVIELGCGTGYVSAWCLAAGARIAIGLDNSIEQLRSAQQLQAEFDRPFPLVRSQAELLPFASDSFDVAINEYGAATWCDPHVWIPEAARVLRPGGNLVFLAWSTLMSMIAPDFEHERTGTELLRPQRGLHQVGFPDTDGVQLALSHGDWIKLLVGNGFRIDRLIELYAPDADAGGPERYSYYDASWARQWPPEEIWCATYLG